MNYNEETVSVVFETASESLSEILAQVGEGVESENWIEGTDSNNAFSYYHSCRPNIRLDNSDEYLEATITQVEDELSILLSYTFYPKEYGLALDEVADSNQPFFAVSANATRKLTRDEMNPEESTVVGPINQLIHTVYDFLRTDEELNAFHILEVSNERHEEVEHRISELLELKIAELGWDFV